MARQQTGFALGVILVQILFAFGNRCNWQYFKHYEQKGCRAILGRDSCPVRFHCDELSEDDFKSCLHNRRLYKDGDDIKELGPCQSCSCIVDRGSAYMECNSVDCPQWEPHNKSCYMGYKPAECCPVEMCPNPKDTRKACHYKGKEYKIGEIVETSKPCKTCICTEKWTNEDGPGCSSVDCLTGIHASKIRRGCLPIYSEDSCCITEMYCDGIQGSIPVSLVAEEKEIGNYCHYGGKYYKKGSTVLLDTDCISCKCTTPPDFTCLRKSCPLAPRDDCRAVYGHCCPDYQCP